MPFVYGHRGTRRGAPENTLEAIRLAIAQGADGIEIDVRLCRSGEVVVLHDPDLLRVAGTRALAAESSWSDLQQIDLGVGTRVPTLSAAMELVLGAGKLLNIELKNDVPDPHALVAAVVLQLQGASAQERERVLLSSFGFEICGELIDLLPDVAVGALFEHVPSALPSGLCAVHPRHVLVKGDAVTRWREQHMLINTWTVNDARHAMRLADAGVDAIITDDVPAVLAAL